MAALRHWTSKQAARPIDATVTLPGSKSYTNRALLVAALANGQSTLREALFSDDTDAMVACLRALGIAIDVDAAQRRFVVSGHGGRIPATDATLFAGAAGTAARFLTALLPLGHGTYQLDGTARMRQRPMAPLLAALRSLGADITCTERDDCLPVVVHASGFRGGRASITGNQSSQFFSALLLPAPCTRDGVDLRVVGDLVSKPYIDLTIDVMGSFGADVTNAHYRTLTVAGGQRYTARDYDIEPDASGASYFFAAAAITGGRVRVQNLAATSAQGDVAFVDVLEQMGCQVTRGSNFIEVRGPEHLRGIDVDMNGISDTVQTLAAIAPFASEPVIMRNIGHIRLKETDRIAALTAELVRLGATVEENPDALVVQPSNLHAADIQTYDDHRMAMSFAVTALKVPGLRIADPACVTKTFPDFFERFEAMVEGSIVPGPTGSH